MFQKQPKIKLKESELQKAILEYLKFSAELIYWRQNLGGVMRQSKGKLIFAKNPMKGFPDICGITSSGKFWGIEVKSEKGKCSDEQNAWHNALELSGAMIFVVRSMKEAIEAIQKIKN